MKDRDYLWCALNLMLDDEEMLDRLCPSCRSLAEGGCCPSCGGEMSRSQVGVNLSFDLEKFEQLKLDKSKNFLSENKLGQGGRML